MTGFIEGNFTYSLLLGMLAAINPCGFVLLPAYLVSYLGIKDDATSAQRLQRSLIVGSMISMGFVGVFVIVGTVSRLFGNWLEVNAKYAGLLIGVVLMVVGLRMLAGWRPRLWIPAFSGTSDRRSVLSMMGFGVVYAIASIGCTIGLLTTAILGSFARTGFVSGVVSVALYGVGMGLFVTALTATLAFAKSSLNVAGRRLMRGLGQLSSVLVLFTGVYLTWYWFIAITERTEVGGLVATVGAWQSRLTERIVAVGALPMLGVFIAIIAATLFVSFRRDSASRP